MEAVARYIESTDWISAIFLLGLLLLVFAKGLFYSRFLTFVILPFNNKYIILNNKKGKLLSGFHLSLSLFQWLNLSLFGFFALQALVPDSGQWDPLVLFFILFGAILGFTLAKLLLQLACGYLFDNTKMISYLVFQKWSYLNYSTLVLFPVNLLLTYLFPGSKVLVLIGVILLFAVNIAGWANILKIHQKVISAQFFYFILYLCALEIAPVLIVTNLVNA